MNGVYIRTVKSGTDYLKQLFAVLEERMSVNIKRFQEIAYR